MKTPQTGTPVRALLAGTVCLAILGGMMVGHAWPLWAGETVIMKVTPVDPRDLFRGEFVRLNVPGTTLEIAATSSGEPLPGVVRVRPTGKWWDSWSEVERTRGQVVYVQLAPAGDGSGEVHPVSISRARVADATNLKGRIRSAYGSSMLSVDYGLDAFFMQEGTALPVEDAMRAGRNVQMELAIASSGRARIRNLRIDGTPVLNR